MDNGAGRVGGRIRRIPAAIAAIALLAAWPTPASADHETGEDDIFDHRGGNEWWVELQVDRTTDLSGGLPPEVRDEGGAWLPMERPSWAPNSHYFVKSFHIEPGHDVRFRVMVDGTWHPSCWFTHPGGRAPDGGATCGVEDGTPPAEFDASFRTPGGNEWWVEVYVDANEPLAGVDARDDGGAWVPLEKRSWGAWAKSFRVEDGSIVDFRATSADGDQDISLKYRWPGGQQVTEQPPPTSPVVAFGPKASNEWWVETMVAADGDIAAVEARADGGRWHALEHTEWGSYAASFHAPDGSMVEFRATLADGTSSVSDTFVWPQADNVVSTGAWPEEGSYAYYSVSWGISGTQNQADVEALFIHTAGRWVMECRGTDEGGSPVFAFEATAPPFGPTGTSVGDDVTVEHRDRCGKGSYALRVHDARNEGTHQDGDAVTVSAWYGAGAFEGNDFDEAAWETDTGLVVGWHNGGTEFQDGLLLDTNAPVG